MSDLCTFDRDVQAHYYWSGNSLVAVVKDTLSVPSVLRAILTALTDHAQI